VKQRKTRKEKTIETKKKIYEAADKLFRKYSFDKVTVDTIVETAGVSKGAFYIYFESKDALIANLIADTVNNVDLDYISYVQSFPVGTPASDILISLAGKIADVITNFIGYDAMKIIYEVQITKTVNTNALLSYNRDVYKLFNEVITLGVQQGEFNKKMPIDTIAKHFIIALRGLTYEWCIRYPDFDLKFHVLEHFKILLTGIRRQENH